MSVFKIRISKVDIFCIQLMLTYGYYLIKFMKLKVEKYDPRQKIKKEN